MYNASVLGWMASLAWLFFLLAAWEGVWKAIALWRSGRNNQVAWFVCIFIFNTLGILPIIYLLWFQKKERKPAVRRKSSRSKSSGSRSRSRSRRK